MIKTTIVHISSFIKINKTNKTTCEQPLGMGNDRFKP
jgi:hypothetical protein